MELHNYSHGTVTGEVTVSRGDYNNNYLQSRITLWPCLMSPHNVNAQIIMVSQKCPS